MRVDTGSGLSFTAIDFETANGDRSSVCAVGMTRVRDGAIVEEFSTLVLPPTGTDSFLPVNTAIHGIASNDVRNSPEWGTVFEQIAVFIGDDDLVAHNAPFDRSVMEQACSAFDIDWPSNRWFDTLSASRVALTLASYSLPFVSAALGLRTFDHHDAQADATQAALVTIELSRRASTATLDQLSPYMLSKVFPADERREAGDFSSIAGALPLTGQSVAFTGKLTTTTRDEAIALVDSLGGVGQAGVTKATTILVTGDFDPRTFRPEAKLSTKLEKAQRLALGGQPIEIVTEVEFLSRIDVSREELERATRSQRVAARSGWLPAYVIDQARAIADVTLGYSSWLSTALRHPDGRAVGGEDCIRCGGPIPATSYWMLLDRHVCSGDCNESLKRAAKRAWSTAGIARPEAPSYAESYGRRLQG